MNNTFSYEDMELLLTAVSSQKREASKIKNEYLLSRYGSLLAKLQKQFSQNNRGTFKELS